MWKASVLGFGILVGMSAAAFGAEVQHKCNSNDYDCLGSLPGPYSRNGQGRDTSYGYPRNSQYYEDFIQRKRGDQNKQEQ